MRDEFTFSASDNDDAPDGPMLLPTEWKKKKKDKKDKNKQFWSIRTGPDEELKSKTVRDVLTFSNDANNDASDSPIPWPV